MNGVLLIRTKKPFSKDDAFTHSYQTKLRDEEGYASEINIQKVCERRETSSGNNAILTLTGWPSLQFASINSVSDSESTNFRQAWAEKVVNALNNVD
jgi:hypothetical protein